MQIRTGKRDFVWNYLGLFFRMGTSIVLMPFVLRFLTDDLVGLWYIFLSVSSFVTTFQAGFAPTFARNVAYCWSGARSFCRDGVSEDVGDDVDYGVFACLLAACRRVYRVISIVVVAFVAFPGSAYIWMVSEGMPLTEWVVPWMVFCVAVFLNVYFSYYESLLRGIGDLPGINKATIASNAVQMVVALGMLLAGCGLIACALGYLVQGVLFRSLCRRWFLGRRKVADGLASACKPESNGVSEIVRAVYPNAAKDTVVSVANYCMSGAITILCSLYLSLADTGNFSVLLQVFNAVANVSMVVLTTYQPALQSACANGDRSLERKLSGRVLSGYLAVFALMFVIVLACLPVLTLIKPSFAPSLGLCFLMGVYMCMWKLYSICATLITNTNHIPYMWAFVVSAALGVALSALLTGAIGLGPYGLILGQGLIQLAYNVWKWPREAARRLGTTVHGLIREGFIEWGESLRGFCRDRRNQR